MVRRARLIYNPSSGREENRRRLPDILQALEEGGLETSCHATRKEGDAAAAAKEAVQRGFDIVIAAGGDGTLHEVINGLAEQPNRPALGLIPSGTTNDFARALGIPKHWKRACDIIVKQHRMPIDIGKINDKYFINIAGGGSLTELTYEVPSKLKTILGQLAYYMKGIEKLPGLRPFSLKMVAPERTVEEDVMLFMIANSKSVGGFENLVPYAQVDDGLLDVIVLKKCNLPEFVRLASIALRGEALDDRHIIRFQTRQVEVDAADGIMLNLDGELGGTLPVKICALPRHIDLLVDPSGESSYRDERDEEEGVDPLEKEVRNRDDRTGTQK